MVLTAALLLLAGVDHVPKSRPARCDIHAAGGMAFKGPCAFLPEEKGTFSVQRDMSAPLFGNIEMVTVVVTGPGEAMVQGLTGDGIVSRWGPATRSKTDKACWVGEDFRICAY
ncbi:hypothetical protein GCM10023219_03060 [Stakelama sediminis]|uniref:Uncharacterized protein n=1 Tax=Stakelama sediminis TaxID=463200 RepID=A0A840YZZ1_9SPHN|nr:hypothetical protein [Stakelama sediminis]MBB5719064.1 hypothetical protein [Stakelama sediminis]